MERVIVEFRAAEGGEDAKMLIRIMADAYVNAATMERL